MKKYILFSVLLIMQVSFENMVFSQNGTIKGRVFNVSNNEGIPFANIVIFGTNIGSTSDFDGNFIFAGIEPGFLRLAVSSIGYEQYVTEEFMVTNQRTFEIDIPLKETQISLEEVVIKASPFARSDESPVSMRRIGIQEIEKNPGGNRDISKVIQSLPGVAATVSFRNDVIIRGGGANENRFYLDGIEIPNINHFATQGASGGPVGIINVDFLREVEMYTGAFPANRGNAVSSIFEFKLLDGSTEQRNVRATVGASDLALTYNGPVLPKTTLIASVRRSYLQFLFSAIGLPFLPAYNDFQFKTKTKFDNKRELTLLGIGAIDQFKLNLNANETEEQRYILSYLPVSEQWNYTVGANYKVFKGNGFHTFVLSRNMLRNFSYKYPDNNESLPRTYDYVSDEIENKLRYENYSLFGDIKLVYGLGGEYVKYNNKTFQKIFTNEVTFKNYATEIDFFKWQAFAQASKPFLNNKLILSLGLRADANNFDKSMSNLLDQISPRISASYALKENLFVSFNTGRYFQTPSYTTLGFRNNMNVLVNKENNIKYIQADHIVAGLEYFPSTSSKISVEGFYKNYSHYPFSVKDSVPLGSKSADFGIFGDEEVLSITKGRAYGAEFFYRETMFKGFNIILSYTFVRSEFKKLDGQYIPSAWDSRHILNLTALKSLPRNWDIGAKFKFSGGAPYTPYDMELSSNKLAWDLQRMGYLDYDNFNSKRLSPFHQLDLRIDKKYFFNKWSLMLYFDVQNVYNFTSQLAPNVLLDTDSNGQPIIENPNAPVEEQKYRLKTVNNDVGTVLPTLGIMIEF
ncbi:MAG: TonB-dependent receptor [Bacteroidales bacterium]|nr:TonB-dependent receptor [Bacteroidales bacterium]